MVALYVSKLDSIIDSSTCADGSIVCDQVRLDDKLSSRALMVALYVIKLDSIKAPLGGSHGSIVCNQVRLDQSLFSQVLSPTSS